MGRGAYFEEMEKCGFAGVVEAEEEDLCRFVGREAEGGQEIPDCVRSVESYQNRQNNPWAFIRQSKSHIMKTQGMLLKCRLERDSGGWMLVGL